jgi:hypothetical protein
MAGVVQYGAAINAYVIHLLVAQMVSLKRVQQPMCPPTDQLNPRRAC